MPLRQKLTTTSLQDCCKCSESRHTITTQTSQTRSIAFPDLANSQRSSDSLGAQATDWLLPSQLKHRSWLLAVMMRHVEHRCSLWHCSTFQWAPGTFRCLSWPPRRRGSCFSRHASYSHKCCLIGSNGCCCCSCQLHIDAGCLTGVPSSKQ